MSEDPNQHSTLADDVLQMAENLMWRWVEEGHDYQGSTEACQILADYAHHLFEQLERVTQELEAAQRIAPAGRESEMEAQQRRRADGLQEQLETAQRERDVAVHNYNELLPLIQSLQGCVCRHPGEACSAPDHRSVAYPATSPKP